MPVTPLELRNRAIKAVYQAAVGAPGIVFVDTITPAQFGVKGQDSGLEVDFEVNLHLQPEPQSSRIRVQGVSRERAKSIQTAFRQARSMSFSQRSLLRAGRIVVTAGYEKNNGLMFDHSILNVIVDSRDDSITIEAQDGRVEWENAFVGASLPGGVPLSVVQDIIQAAVQPGLVSDADFKAALTKKLSDYQLATGNVSGTAELGLCLLGQTKEPQRDLNDTLGIKQAWQNGYPVTVPANSASLGPAVLLGGPGGYGLLNAQTLEADGLRGPGWVQIETLLLHQLVPGRQIILQDATGAPRDGGIFRVDNVTHRGERSGSDWTSTCMLRPTSLV